MPVLEKVLVNPRSLSSFHHNSPKTSAFLLLHHHDNSLVDHMLSSLSFLNKTTRYLNSWTAAPKLTDQSYHPELCWLTGTDGRFHKLLCWQILAPTVATILPATLHRSKSGNTEPETVNVNTRSPSVRCASGVKWYTHFPSPKWVESRLPRRQLGFPPSVCLVWKCYNIVWMDYSRWILCRICLM